MTNKRFDEFSDERIQTNGVTLRCRFAGKGPAVLLLHGWCGSSHSWRKVAPRLADHFTVIVPDMRGYGDSDKPETGYDAHTGAADIAGLLDHFEADRAHLVGHDMGAPVGLVFSGLFPTRSLSVTYLDEPLPGYNLEHYTAFLRENHGGFWQFGLNFSPRLAEILYAGHEVEFLRHIFSEMTMVRDAITEADVREHARGMLQPGGITGWVGWYRAAFDTADQLRALGDARAFKTPIMAYGGERGVVETCDQLRALSHDVRGGVIDGVGHLIPEEVPDRLASLLFDFFASVEPEKRDAHK